MGVREGDAAGEEKEKKKKIICREGVGQSGQKRVEGVTLRPLSWSLISLNHLETIIILFNIFLFFLFFFGLMRAKGEKKKSKGKFRWLYYIWLFIVTDLFPLMPPSKWLTS